MSIDHSSGEEAWRLVFQHRWAALATLAGDKPSVSMVAYVPYLQTTGLLFFLSQLSPHTQHLLKRPDCSLAISQSDDGEGDPQTLARLTLDGCVEIIGREASTFKEAKACYCRCLPTSERLFEFADFVLFRFVPIKGRYIGGFGRAYNLSTEQFISG